MQPSCKLLRGRAYSNAQLALVYTGLRASIRSHLTLLYITAVKSSASLWPRQGNEISLAPLASSAFPLVPDRVPLFLSQHKPPVPVAHSVFIVYQGSFS